VSLRYMISIILIHIRRESEKKVGVGGQVKEVIGWKVVQLHSYSYIIFTDMPMF
jgi:hypothetical protein